MPDQDNKCTCSEQPLVPIIVEVIDIIDRTPDVKSFFVKNSDGNGVPFQVAPGQCGMVSLLPVGEAHDLLYLAGRTGIPGVCY